MVNAQDVEDVLLKATNAISRLGRVIPLELRFGFFSYVKHLRMTNVRVRCKTKIVAGFVRRERKSYVRWKHGSMDT